MGAPKLTPKQARFVAEYLVDLNATQAAIRVGYSRKTANICGPRLLSNASVAAAAASGKAEQLKTAELTAAGILEAIRRQVHGDIRKLYDAAGNFKFIHDMTEEEAAILAGLDTTYADITPGTKGPPAKILKVKLANRADYVRMGAQHFALLTDVVRQETAESLSARLDRGRDRVAEAKRARAK